MGDSYVTVTKYAGVILSILDFTWMDNESRYLFRPIHNLLRVYHAPEKVGVNLTDNIQMKIHRS